MSSSVGSLPGRRQLCRVSSGCTTKFILEETEQLEAPGAPAKLLWDQTCRISMGRGDGSEQYYFQGQNEWKRRGAEIYA